MAKIRYIHQQDEYSCGPVALANILKWAGHKATLASLPALRKLCKCHPKTGTNKEDLEVALKALGIKFRRDIGPTLKEIDQHIDGGGVLLINYCIAIGHYALCIGRQKKTYTLVNAFDNVTLSDLARNDLRYMLEWWLDGEEHWVWFIYPSKLSETKVKTHTTIRS